jgi:hypothetical protein
MDYFDITIDDEERTALLKLLRQARDYNERRYIFRHECLDKDMEKLDKLIDKLDL